MHVGATKIDSEESDISNFYDEGGDNSLAEFSSCNAKDLDLLIWKEREHQPEFDELDNAYFDASNEHDYEGNDEQDSKGSGEEWTTPGLATSKASLKMLEESNMIRA